MLQGALGYPGLLPLIGNRERRLGHQKESRRTRPLFGKMKSISASDHRLSPNPAAACDVADEGLGAFPPECCLVGWKEESP